MLFLFSSGEKGNFSGPSVTPKKKKSNLHQVLLRLGSEVDFWQNGTPSCGCVPAPLQLLGEPGELAAKPRLSSALLFGSHPPQKPCVKMCRLRFLLPPPSSLLPLIWRFQICPPRPSLEPRPSLSPSSAPAPLPSKRVQTHKQTRVRESVRVHNVLDDVHEKYRFHGRVRGTRK